MPGILNYQYVIQIDTSLSVVLLKLSHLITAIYQTQLNILLHFLCLRHLTVSVKTLFLGCPFVFVHSSSQILLPQYLMSHEWLEQF